MERQASVCRCALQAQLPPRGWGRDWNAEFLGWGRPPCALPGRRVLWSSLPGETPGAAAVHFAGTMFAAMWPPSCFLGNRAPRSVSAPVAPGRLLPLFLLSTPSLSSCHTGFREHPPKPSDELGPLCWHPLPGLFFRYHVSAASLGSLLRDPFLSDTVPGWHLESVTAPPQHPALSVPLLLSLGSISHPLTS